MVDPRRERDGGSIKPSDAADQKGAGREHRSKREGTNRDFDTSGESANQGHGHPREERSGTREE